MKQSAPASQVRVHPDHLCDECDEHFTTVRVLLDDRGGLAIHGDHATELVHVTVLITRPGHAILRWSDGIMGPLPDIHLKRG